MGKIFTSLIFLLFMPLFSEAYGSHSPQLQKKFTISGYVSDKDNGEMLAGVTIFMNNLKTGTSTNTYGFYSITIPAGNYDLQYSYIGYQTLYRKALKPALGR
jgi:hypothetical protein